jgi:hypothetical protein
MVDMEQWIENPRGLPWLELVEATNANARVASASKTTWLRLPSVKISEHREGITHV